MIKKLSKIAVVFFMSFQLLFLTACGDKKQSMNSKQKPKKVNPIKIGIVTDINGVNGNDVNKELKNSIEKLEKSKKVKLSILQSHNKKDYILNLRDMAEMDSKLIFVRGSDFENSIKLLAEKYKDRYFCIIDGIVNKPNVISVNFKENEGAFLAGILASEATQNKIIGFIGDNDDINQKRYEVGFKAGVYAINPQIKIITNYIDNSVDIEKAKKASKELNEKGADIIFTSCNKSGEGVILASKEKNFWIINSSKYQSSLGKKNVLAYVYKNTEKVVKKVTGDYNKKKIKGLQVYKLGIKEGMIDLIIPNGNVPKEMTSKIKEFKDIIKKGELKVPENEKEFNKYKEDITSKIKEIDDKKKKEDLKKIEEMQQSEEE